MAEDFRGRVCILTGASGGIGAALASALAEDGLEMALVARRAGPLEEAAAAIRDAGGQARAYPTDLLDPDATAAMVARVRDELGPCAVLVNNAGVETFQHFHEADSRGIEQAIALNVTAPLLLTRAVLPDMLATRGVVVNLASTAGLFGTPHGAVYSATKAAVLSATRSLRMEYAGGPSDSRRSVRASCMERGCTRCTSWRWALHRACSVERPSHGWSRPSGRPFGRIARRSSSTRRRCGP